MDTDSAPVNGALVFVLRIHSLISRGVIRRWSIALAIGRRACGLGSQLRDAMLVAIHALHPMDVVPACLARVCCVHRFHVDSAVRHGRMARGARGTRAFAVPAVT